MAGSGSETKESNRLIHETSTYLLQHAYNPVDWYPWGEEALEKARAENKPILLSIGYAACHWCHVMEHESFEDESTASMMNELFVNIKVDREERTDLDEIYMKAVQLMTGHGGWPMTVFLTPSLEPFFAGTYFPPQDRHGMPSFKRVIAGVARAWQEKPEEVLGSASEITEHLRAFEELGLEAGDGSGVEYDTIEQSLARLVKIFDPTWGGFGGAPKFPHSFCIDLALRSSLPDRPLAEGTKRQLREIVTTTLDKMAEGGIQDHLGGGFARYSVDRQWLVPHFEKMLYDNALLCQIYLRASRIVDRPYWRRVAAAIIDFAEGELITGEGAFYSSLDADSEGEEGKFYVFGRQEIIDLLGEDDGSWVAEIYGVTATGNFEHGKSVLHLRKPLSDAERDRLEPLRKRLFDERAGRVRPGRDEKVLTSWNSLMISALVEAYLVLKERRYLEAARRTASFILDNLVEDGKLLRTWGRGKARLSAYLDDYAYLTEALLDLASVDGDPVWYEKARYFLEYMLEHFPDRENGGFFYTADDHEELVVRPRSHFDGSVPSGSSVAARCLLRMARLEGKESYLEATASILSLYAPVARRSPDQFANMLCVMDSYLRRPREIALVYDSREEGSKTHEAFLFALNTSYRPDDLVLLFDCASAGPHPSPLLQGKIASGGKPTVYICRDFTCAEPIDDIDRLKEVVSEYEVSND